MNKKTIAIGVIILLLALTVLPWLIQTNPPVVAEPPWDSLQTRELAERACLECHRNSTKWPLYSRLPLVSLLITKDVLQGRQHLNLSEWGAANASGRERRSAQQIARQVSSGEMPPALYLPLHPEANLSPAEKQQLIDGLLKSLNQ